MKIIEIKYKCAKYVPTSTLFNCNGFSCPFLLPFTQTSLHMKMCWCINISTSLCKRYPIFQEHRSINLSSCIPKWNKYLNKPLWKFTFDRFLEFKDYSGNVISFINSNIIFICEKLCSIQWVYSLLHNFIDIYLFCIVICLNFAVMLFYLSRGK